LGRAWKQLNFKRIREEFEIIRKNLKDLGRDCKIWEEFERFGKNLKYLGRVRRTLEGLGKSFYDLGRVLKIRKEILQF
jgi:hypothetical protein